MMKRQEYGEKLHDLNIDKILVESLLDDIEWYEDEIDEMFISYSNYTWGDVNQAMSIINAMKNILSISSSLIIRRTVEKTIETIKKLYPEFFDPLFWLE